MYEKLPTKIQDLWKNLSEVLNAFGEVGDRLDPTQIISDADKLNPKAEELKKTLNELEPIYSLDKDSTEYALTQAASQALQAVARFETARVGPHEIMKAYQSFRPMHRAEEILYPLAAQYEEISCHFLHPSQKTNEELLNRFSKSQTSNETVEFGNVGTNAVDRGIIEVNNKRGQRGGYTVYVPEYYETNRKYPLVVALHGGSGHGADFFWSWLRDARTFGFILAAPTSLDRTWSIHSNWMFPVAGARLAATALEKAGAKLNYKEIPDLSHNYPRDENEKILNWFYPEGFEGSKFVLRHV